MGNYTIKSPLKFTIDSHGYSIEFPYSDDPFLKNMFSIYILLFTAFALFILIKIIVSKLLLGYVFALIILLINYSSIRFLIEIYGKEYLKSENGKIVMHKKIYGLTIKKVIYEKHISGISVIKLNNRDFGPLIRSDYKIEITERFKRKFQFGNWINQEDAEKVLEIMNKTTIAQQRV
jgi:hypothetical protein